MPLCDLQQDAKESVTHAHMPLDWTASCIRQLVTTTTAATRPIAGSSERR